jgi:hypothetical protein
MGNVQLAGQHPSPDSHWSIVTISQLAVQIAASPTRVTIKHASEDAHVVGVGHVLIGSQVFSRVEQTVPTHLRRTTRTAWSVATGSAVGYPAHSSHVARKAIGVRCRLGTHPATAVARNRAGTARWSTKPRRGGRRSISAAKHVDGTASIPGASACPNHLIPRCGPRRNRLAILADLNRPCRTPCFVARKHPCA